MLCISFDHNLHAVVDLLSAVQSADHFLSDLLQLEAGYSSPQRKDAFVEIARNEMQLVVARLSQLGQRLRLNHLFLI
jgi:hypothetical protein